MTPAPRHILTALAVLLATVLPALARAPLPIDSETPVDRRVLTRPAAILRDAPGGEPMSRPDVFTAFYVFDEMDRGGTTWLELGANRDGNRTMWMDAAETVAWKQTITLSFESPANRLPVLFFKDRAAIEGFVADEAMSTRAELVARSLQMGQTASDEGVIAVEPATAVPLTERFYLLPILDFADVRVNRRPRKILEVASINQSGLDQPPARTEPFRVGITFVIDTSVSMQPYIERTKSAIRKFLSDFRKSGEDRQFSFGLIGFRGDATLVPALEFTTHEYFRLAPDFDEPGFLAALDSVRQAPVSSRDFDEDGLAGLKAALDNGAWRDFDGRYIIYVSDAGMLAGSGGGSLSGTTPATLASRAADSDVHVAIFALFLKSRAGQAYHEDALAQLQQVTAHADGDTPRVFEIENADLTAFGNEVDELSDALLGSIGVAMDARAPRPTCAPGASAVLCAASEAGYAMSLDWLGRQQQTEAPPIYRAWAADFALDDPSARAMEPRVLLTRGQLNDLYITLQSIIEAARQTTDTDPDKLFSVLRTVLGRVLRDPGSLPALDASQTARVAGMETFDDLGDLVQGYLYGLPYDSDLSLVTRDSWIDRGATGRQEMIATLEAKLAMYELYYNDSASWIALNPDADETEKVYPLPIELIP